jgi:hypothetical protein
MPNNLPSFKYAKYLPAPISSSPFTSVNKMMCGFLCKDRFNVLNKYSEFRMDTSADPIPVPFTESVSFADLMDLRATELLSGKQQIGVMYSGGVDSTAVLISMMKQIPENEWDRIKVFYDTEAITENPEFWKVIKASKIQKVLFNRDSYDSVIKNEDYDILTFGWCADQMFGSDVHLRVPDAYHHPWLQGIKEAFKLKFGLNLPDTSLDAINEVFSEYARTFGLTLNQFCEFAWLFNWGVKWGHVAIMPQMDLVGSKNADKGIAFFNTSDFEKYSLSNFENLHKVNIYKEVSEYKKPLKQYIYDYNHIEDYFVTKGKQNSFGRIAPTNDKILVLTDQGYKLFSAKKTENPFGFLWDSVLEYFKKSS